jgi:hypothetical protein
MKLDRKQIIKIQKNRDPYLLIDCATKVIPGKYAEGFKILKKNEWFFKVHWPGDPNMPGMLQAEAMVQMSSLIVFTLPEMKGKILYLVDGTNLKFFKKGCFNKFPAINGLLSILYLFNTFSNCNFFSFFLNKNGNTKDDIPLIFVVIKCFLYLLHIL